MTVAGHEGVSQQPRGWDILRGLPMQCQISKSLPSLFGNLHWGCKCINRCQRRRNPLVVYVTLVWCAGIFIQDESSPIDILLLALAMITPQAIVVVMKITTRKMSILLDRWYMACNRAIMMTSMTFQWSKQRWGTAAGWLTVQHGIHDERRPQPCNGKNCAWKNSQPWKTPS